MRFVSLKIFNRWLYVLHVTLYLSYVSLNLRLKILALKNFSEPNYNVMESCTYLYNSFRKRVYACPSSSWTNISPQIPLRYSRRFTNDVVLSQISMFQEKIPTLKLKFDTKNEDKLHQNLEENIFHNLQCLSLFLTFTKRCKI